MRPEGVFTAFHKLINLFQAQPENNPPALSQLRWPPFELTADQLACDCSICKMPVELVNGLNLITNGIQLYGGIVNLPIPEFDHTQTLYERLADCSYKPALSYCLKTQVTAAMKSIDCDLIASVTRSSLPIVYHNYLTDRAVKAEAERRLSRGPKIELPGGSRSFVAFSKRVAPADNLVRLPVTLHSIEAQAPDGPEPARGAARVISFQEWIGVKEKRGANKDNMTRRKIRRMTMREKRLRILDLISDDDMDHQTLASILEFLESITPDTESRS